MDKPIEQKEKIINLLKEHDSLPVSRIRSMTNMDYYKLLDLINEMKEQSLIELGEGKQSKQWHLKKGVK